MNNLVEIVIIFIIKNFKYSSIRNTSLFSNSSSRELDTLSRPISSPSGYVSLILYVFKILVRR